MRATRSPGPLGRWPPNSATTRPRRAAGARNFVPPLVTDYGAAFRFKNPTRLRSPTITIVFAAMPSTGSPRHAGAAGVLLRAAEALRRRSGLRANTIVMEIEDQDYSGRLYSCRDPEGHLWNFGTYDPWA